MLPFFFFFFLFTPQNNCIKPQLFPLEALSLSLFLKAALLSFFSFSPIYSPLCYILYIHSPTSTYELIMILLRWLYAVTTTPYEKAHGFADELVLVL